MHLFPVFLVAVGAVTAQNFVATPNGMTVVPSQNYPGASIEYKAVSICETTPGVKSYSGYVHLPSSLLADVPASYNASLFFWYFEARNDPANAPLSIFVGGGPGSSGFDDSSGFPCIVSEDGNTTTVNPFSWNRNVNMLYVDQPVTTGFSYTSLTNGILDLLGESSAFTPVADRSQFRQTNLTTVGATVSLPDPSATVNTTAQAARTMWHFAQVWFQEFPEYNTTNDEISIWTVSYGGFFGPGIFSHFQRQNERIASGTFADSKAKILKLGTVGIQNGCIDSLAQAMSFPEFAFNNTYGIQAYPKEIYEQARSNITRPGGCFDMIAACRAAAAEGDPLDIGANATVNALCAEASSYCFGVVQNAFVEYSGRNPFDIAHAALTLFPPPHNTAYLNQPHVQAALGTPLNFTLTSPFVVSLFFGVTGDPMRRTLADLEFLLSRGLHLALVYGDRDYRCNWLGAENVSLAMNYEAASSFRAAGYAEIKTNASYVGGLVRQHGHVSFSRVFQAGHNVAAYQPETVLRIFERAMSGRDVATGNVAVKDGPAGYASSGPASSFGVKNAVPSEGSEPVCYLLETRTTCAPNQLAALRDGTAVVQNWKVISPKAELGDGGGGTPGPVPTDTPGSENAAGRPAGARGLSRIMLWTVVYWLVFGM